MSLMNSQDWPAAEKSVNREMKIPNQERQKIIANNGRVGGAVPGTLAGDMAKVRRQ